MSAQTFRVCISTTKKTTQENELGIEGVLAHTLVLTSPAVDVFLNWKHTCTPFSFRSMLRTGISLDLLSRFMAAHGQPLRPRPADSSGWDIDALFTGFDGVMRRLVQLVEMCPERFIIRWSIESQDLSLLVFYEVVLGYRFASHFPTWCFRMVKLLELEMRPNEWENIVSDTNADLDRIEVLFLPFITLSGRKIQDKGKTCSSDWNNC